MAQKRSHANLKVNVRARLESALARRQADVERYSRNPDASALVKSLLKTAQRDVEGIKKHLASLRTKPKHH